MQIILNGEATQIPDSLTVAQLIEHLKLGQRRVAVELNREIVPKSRHPETPVSEGDVVELVTAIGGG
ncbi:MAG: sulfur carrier protein ThiS [Lysobacteraceae bacterium]|nr:sulfur carrier protein ThiS [Xanthomonadales bacterium]HPF72862.1 sulfur carrier protein ThiS [Xanthomonadaceae bacterium]HRX99103.1 sulfur carrier protein ThiS [Xanthomonadaceae bacterium]